jgi:hypothetical protein
MLPLFFNNQMYNIEYHIGNRKLETIYNKPTHVAHAIISNLASTTHKIGKFKLIKIN